MSTRRRPKRSPRPAIPPNFERTVERWRRLESALQPGADIAAEIREREARLEELLAPIDAVHLLGHIVMSEFSLDAETYKETEHEGAAHVAETVAAVLTARPSRAGQRSVTPAIDANTVGPIRELAHELALLEGLRRFAPRPSERAEGELRDLRRRAAMHDLLVRAPGWPWQEEETLGGLFGPSHLAERLREALGFDAEDAIGCVAALGSVLDERRAAGRDEIRSGRHTDDALAWANQTLRGWQERNEPFRYEYLTLIWWMNRIGETMIVDAETLAAAAGIDPEHAASYLRALSTAFGQDNELYARIDQIRRRPYLDLGGGRYFCALPGGDLWALRPLFESALKTGERYQRHRARWLERRAGELLAGALAPDELHHGVKLMTEDGKRQLGEVDALLRLDDTVLAVEAKGASMKPGARRGGESLIDHLRKNLTKAAEQGSLARAALRGETEVKLVAADGSPLELGAAVREVHPIVVTLEDLSSVAPTLWQVAGTVVLPSDVTIPWVVTLFELEHVCSTVESPPQFVHFLRRRARLNQLGGRIASDELDWWMLYLDTSLYFEDEEPGPTRRYLSLTDPLDAWVLHQRGLRKSAPKPLQRLDAKSRAMLQTLTAERPDGWVAAGCLLLECDDAGRRELHTDLRAARRRAAKSHKVQRGTRAAKDRATEFLLAYVVVPDEGAGQLRDQLIAYIDERLGEYGAQRVLAIGAAESSKRPYDAFVVIEHGRWDLPQAA